MSPTHTRAATAAAIALLWITGPVSAHAPGNHNAHGNALTQAGDTVIDAFDAAVSHDLPHTLTIPQSAHDDHARQAPLSLTVIAPLPVTVNLPDGRQAHMYEGELHGAPVSITRSPERLDITEVTADGVSVISFASGQPSGDSSRWPDVRTTTRRQEASGHPDNQENEEDDVLDDDTVPPPTAEADISEPIEFMLVMHDEIRASRTPFIHARYVAWWLSDLKKNVLPYDPVVLSYVSTPSLSDVPYGHPQMLSDWGARVGQYRAERGLRHTWKRFYILLTDGDPVKGRLGVAMPSAGVAAASLQARYRTLAHEAGHLLGATHRDGLTQWGSWLWPCQTNMRSPDAPLLHNCYVYSPANMARIARHVEYMGRPPAD
ncbi:hypothetical protein FHW69_002125 [Luteibacter sp. Sphag1AF]|uniref:hypothetical protein n=1 Tax=Luteibacter sp. Sphag1AF TaxID=2587031 RepID=UPI0016167CB4|nr:hypothetical protein [Luteibacter sp. Sphag1AF]MBB3227502.1 hypothetical protein [Luteibacter sp. Sphag1AF]